jgi:UDP-N-acetylmuramoyl-L-alanyl-D-glutamate--2,6-diaminopimelate ligase
MTMHRLKKLVPQSAKNIYHLIQAVLANFIYGFPSRKIMVIGVTGTDGKTTTVQMITKILEEAGKKVAMASTINFRLDGKEEKNLSHYTTHSSFLVQKFIRRAVQAGCGYLVLETSSHSLDQYRVWGVDYRTAVITNVTREHLDYHKTMEKYRDAKKRLFEYVSKKNGAIIVNLDMEKPEEYLSFKTEKKFWYSTKDSGSTIADGRFRRVVAGNIQLGIADSEFVLDGTLFKLHVPGMFNVENALAATCVGLSENISLVTIKNALEKIEGVPGRMEHISNNRGIDIIVDYALTPQALEKLYAFLSDAKRKADAKIIAVFGSCGDRDRGKRPIIGKTVSKYADVVILTNDEPYSEKPQCIIKEIASGITDRNEGENYRKIPDRREAIAMALKLAKPGDVIAVTGMGAEESMVIGNRKIPWDDREVIREELAKLE